MKKRSKPILPVTLLIICIAVVVGMNMPKSAPTMDNHQPPAEEPGKPREQSASTKDLKEAASAAMMAPKKPGRMGPGGPDGMPPEAMPPSIEKPSSRISKPVPNDSSISGQWYSDEARKPGS